MNKILFVSIISIFISHMAFAQDSLIKYEKIVILDSSYTKTELFIKARQWISDNFTDANSVITISDKESGELSGNANLEILPLQKKMHNWGVQVVSFKFSMVFKDGKYKYSFYYFEHETIPSSISNLGLLTNSTGYPYKSSKGYYGKITSLAWNDVKEQVNVKAKILSTSLEKAMREKPKNEGW
jgi:hypothetical protein